MQLYEPLRERKPETRALAVAHARGLRPRCVCFDEWYSGRDNLKAVRSYGWTFLTQLRSNRKVNLDRRGNRMALSENGRTVSFYSGAIPLRVLRAAVARLASSR